MDIEQLPLVDWIEQYLDLHDAPQAKNTPLQNLVAARFGLTGLSSLDAPVVAIDTTVDKINAHGTKPYIRRDYDSLIGYTDTFPITQSVAFFPLPSIRQSLSKPVKVLHEFNIISRSTGRVVKTPIDPGRIPNIIFGTFGDRGSVRVHFPRLYVGGTTPPVSDEHREQFYNCVIRRAAQDEMPEAILDWPASYSSALFTYRKPTGGFKETSVLINPELSMLLSARMRVIVDESTDDLDWAKDFVWGTEVRGVKDICFHAVDDPDPTFDCWARLTLMKGIDTELPGTWYADVGLEYIVDGRALLWSLDNHVQILMSTLGISRTDANRIVNRNDYNKDASTHLYSLSGFRAVTSRYGGPSGAVYVQAYTTDKAQTYNPSGGRYGKSITPQEAINGTPPQYCTALANTYEEAKITVDVATRLEVRVPLSQAPRMLLDPPDELWHGMVSYPRQIWWGYRILKLRACRDMLCAVNMVTKNERVNRHILTFILALVYLINSLHSRPDDSSDARSLCRAILPLTDDGAMSNIIVRGGDLEDETNLAEDGGSNSMLMPYAPGGVIYLRPFYLIGEASQVRFINATTLSDKVFRSYWKCEPRHVRETLWPTRTRQTVNGKTVTTRKGATRKIIEDVRNPPSMPEFDALKNVPVTQERTIEEVLFDLVIDEDDRSKTLADRMTSIFKQFITDMIQKMPGTNVKTNPGALISQYCPLSQDERRLVTVEDIHNNGDFTKLFVCLQYKLANVPEWALAVNHLFPCPGHIGPSDMRHYQTCEYYKQWMDLMDELDPEDATRARRTMTNKVLDLPWLPAAGRSRMWDTKEGGDEWIFIPARLAREKKTGPRVLVNRAGTSVRPFIRNLAEEARLAANAALRDEEEESE